MTYSIYMSLNEMAVYVTSQYHGLLEIEPLSLLVGAGDGPFERRPDHVYRERRLLDRGRG